MSGALITGIKYIIRKNTVAVPGGKLYTYQAGTSTPLAVYTDYTLTTPATNPVIMDANGEAVVFLGPYQYKFVEKDASGTLLNTVDGINGNTSSSASSSGFPAGFKNGLTISNNVTTPNTTIDFAAGSCRDSTDTVDITLSSGLSKVLQSSGVWVAGTGQNGLFSGAKANSTWYHCFVIRNNATLQVDAGFDTSLAAANIPTGYSAYRRVGSVFVNSSGNIIQFIQKGDEFIFGELVGAASGSVSPIPNGAGALTVIPTPPGVSTLVRLTVSFVTNGAPGDDIMISSALRPDLPCTAPYAQLHSAGGAGVRVSGQISILTNTASQVRARSVNANASDALSYVVEGWRDFITD